MKLSMNPLTARARLSAVFSRAKPESTVAAPGRWTFGPPSPRPSPPGEGESSSVFKRCERFKISCGCWSEKRKRGDANGDHETLAARAGISLSPGERAGVRASVDTHFPERGSPCEIGATENSEEPHSRCSRRGNEAGGRFSNESASSRRRPRRGLTFLNGLLAFCFVASAGLWFSTGAFAGDVATAFDAANKLYEQGKFAEAAAAYEKLIESGHVSDVLHLGVQATSIESDGTDVTESFQLSPRASLPPTLTKN